jgi:tetratricopeptide (TPR) repeat protein
MVPRGNQGFASASRPNVSGQGNHFANRPNYERPYAGPNRPGAGGGGTQWAGAGNHFNGSTRPGQGGGGERWPGAGNQSNWPSRPGQGGSGEHWPGGGNQPNWPSRPGQGGGGERWPGGSDRGALANRTNIGNRTNFGDRTNIGNRASIGDRTNIGNGAVVGNRTNINSGNQDINVNNNVNNTVVANRGAVGGGGWNNNNWHGAHDYWQPHYSDWHHGSWNNWSQHPAAWYGAGMAATGWLASPGDAYVYSNPFATVPTTVNYAAAPTNLTYNDIDYSQPIAQPPQQVAITYNESEPAPYSDASAASPADLAGQPNDAVAANDAAAPNNAGPPAAGDDGAPPEAFQLFSAARAAFKSNDYGKALAEVDKAIKLLPSDTTTHEFRAWDLFAQAKYQEAASGVYAVLSMGPGWTWDTARELYADPGTYTKQLRSLEEYVRKNPDASDGRFLLAYHYFVLNHVPSAVRQMQDFVKLVPQDKLAPQLITAFTPRDSTQASVEPAKQRSQEIRP